MIENIRPNVTDSPHVEVVADPYMGYVNQLMENLLNYMNVSEGWAAVLKFVVLLGIIITIGWLLYFVVTQILTFIFKRAAKTAPITFLRYLVPNKLPRYVSLIAVYSFLKGTLPFLFSDYIALIKPVLTVLDIAFVFVVIWTIMAFIRSFADGLQEKPAFKDKPMKSYLQVVQIIFFIFGAVAIFSIITGKSATAFFAAMGAASAILMLVFKDTIMGFVSSIQLTANEMVKIGDWITMNKYGADGNIEEISLTTVKVRNFDNTVTTIPTYALISDSFQNWREMQESGGRRIKKSIHIKQSQIRFVTDTELDKYKQIEYLKDYVTRKELEYKELNKLADMNSPIGVHRITNSELFVEYANEYIRRHPKMNKEYTLMVRQLQSTINGMQVEVYAFCDIVALAAFEAVSLEVMNHLISVVPFFDLTLFEETAGSDSLDVMLHQGK